MGQAMDDMASYQQRSSNFSLGERDIQQIIAESQWHATIQLKREMTGYAQQTEPLENPLVPRKPA